MGNFLILITTRSPTVSIDFDTFSFDINKISGGADVDYQVFSSVDGFTAGNELGSGAISTENAWSTESFDVSSLSAVTTATEFRLYFQTAGTFDPNPIKVDNITLTGTAAPIPEPSGALLGGLVLLVLSCRRR